MRIIFSAIELVVNLFASVFFVDVNYFHIKALSAGSLI